MALWKIDTTHTAAEFATRHMMVTTVRGGFKSVTGTINYDPAQVADASVEVVIETKSMSSTGLDQRDGHLKSPDFLDIEKYPTITFKSTKIEPTGKDTAHIHGHLTIKDVTKPVVINAEFLGESKMQGVPHIGFTGTTKIDREDFGLTWNMALETGGWLVGKEISITLDVEAIPAEVPVAA